VFPPEPRKPAGSSLDPKEKERQCPLVKLLVEQPHATSFKLRPAQASQLETDSRAGVGLAAEKPLTADAKDLILIVISEQFHLP
jgi:hypothetical protein